MADANESGETRAPHPSRPGTLSLALLPALVALLLFLPALGTGFVFDDHVDVAQVDAVFVPGAWPQLFATQSAQLYRPVKYLTYHVENALFGWHPWAFHLTSVLLHTATCLLLFSLARRLGISGAGALAGTLWFAVHPIHTEAVVWISSRASLLSAFFAVASLLAYMRWRESGRPTDLVLLALTAFGGFFSKEDMFMIFPAFMVAEYLLPLANRDTPQSGSPVFPVAVLLLVAGTYAFLRQSILSGLDQGTRDHGWSGLAATLPVILARYAGQLVYPPVTTIDQPVDFQSGFGPMFWLSTAVLAALLASCLRRGREASVWRFSIAWFFLFLVPVMGIIPINQPMADRFLYLPSMAGAFLIGAAWDQVAARRPHALPALRAVLGAVLLAYAIRCVADTRVWKSDDTLWTHATSVNPRSYRGFINLAAIANNSERPTEGLALADKALAIKPDYPEAWVTKAFALDRLGRTGEAEALYRQALDRVPNSTVWMYLLADLLARTDRRAEAMALYEAIFAIRPAYLDARLAAGLLAAQAGDLDTAILHWETAARFHPDDEMARHNLEIAQKQRAARNAQPSGH